MGASRTYQPLARVVAAGAMLLTSGCGSGVLRQAVASSEVPRAERELASTQRQSYRAGEEIVAEVRLEGLPAGRLVSRVGPRCQLGDRTALPVTSLARSTGLVAVFKDAEVAVASLLDAQTGLPLQTRTRQRIRRALQIEAVFEPEVAHLQTTRRENRRHNWDQPLPAVAHDLPALVGLLRAWEPEVRPRALAHALVGRRVWRLELSFRGREVLQQADGPRPAVRIDGVGQRLGRSLEPTRAKPRAFALWFSDDSARVPLRFVIETKYGEVQADLVHYALRQSEGSASESTAERGGQGGAHGMATRPGSLPPCPVVAFVDDMDEDERRQAEERAQRSSSGAGVRKGRRGPPR